VLYTVVRYAGLILFALLGLNREGLENLPGSGPVIVVANHISNWDPLILGFALPRPLCYMAKAELFNIPVLKSLLPLVYAFPIKRGAVDRQAIRTALELVKAGKILGIFPEGRRALKGAPIEVKPGAALIALKAGCPILPAACIGTSGILPCGWFKPLKIKLGRPVNTQGLAEMSHAAALEELSHRIEKDINALLQK
jgi:1-acyl-sn-glycerol-3-phosphate acyltransferase